VEFKKSKTNKRENTLRLILYWTDRCDFKHFTTVRQTQQNWLYFSMTTCTCFVCTEQNQVTLKTILK